MIDTNTIGATQKSIIQTLQTKPGLPFKELLPKDVMERAFINVEYRDRI